MSEPSQPKLIRGRYRLEERISRGGSAEVWRGRDEKLDRPVAVKLLHPHLVPDERARLRLAAEGRLAASLTHPAIVQVYDVLVDEEAPALIMELIEGESLDARVKREGALAPRVAAAIGAEVAEGLAEAHSHGIVHRDVKPSNILLDSDGHAHLADFGIAHSLEADAERLTQTGMVVGTPAYLAPEQLAGAEVGARTDLFGLGAVLFQMLTGRPPYAAMAPLRLAEAHAAGPPHLPDIDPALAEITRACLAAAPADRPPNAGFVAATLRSFATMHPAERDADTQTMPIAAPPAAAIDQAPVSRDRRAPIVMGAAGLLAAALLAVALLGPGKPAEGAPPQPSSTPQPAWVAQLMGDYAAACSATLDPAQIAGLSQPDAEARVSSLIDACETAQEAAGGGSDGGGGGKGKGNGHGKP
jgi:eukaryotic-like serine/threonine-protein kinase